MNREVLDIWLKEPHVQKWGLNGYATHQPVLHWVLQQTSGAVIELGSGETSTAFIQEFCKDEQTFISYETNASFFLSNNDKYWNKYVRLRTPDEIEKVLQNNTFGMAFVDHAPGEHRQKCIELLADRADYVVVHDTECKDYGYDFSMYKYQYVFDYYNPYTTILSNKFKIDFK